MFVYVVIIVLIILLILAYKKYNKLEKDRNYWRDIFTNKYVDDD